MLLTHQKRHYALGLAWATAHDAAEARRESKNRPKAHRVVLPSGGQFWLGLYDEPVKGNTYAAALAIGLVEPNVIVCEAVSDTHSWICSIVDGLPVVGYDRLELTEDARDTVGEWTSMFHKAGFVGDLPGAKASLVEVLEQLGQAIDTKRINGKQLAATRLQSQGISLGSVEVSARSVASVMVLAALPALGWFGWQAWLKIKAASAAQQLSMANAAKQAMNAEQIAAERRARAADFQRQVAAKRAELEQQAKASSDAVWHEWHAIRRALPVSAFGYQPTTMKCDTGSCQVEWSGSGPFTLPADKARLPGVLPNMEPTLTASSRFPLSSAPLARPDLVSYTRPEELRFALANAAILHLPGLQVDAMQPVVMTPAPDLGLAPVTLGATGKLRVTLDGRAPLVMAEGAHRFLSQWPVHLTSIRFDSLNQASGITLEGTYIVVEPQRQ